VRIIKPPRLKPGAKICMVAPASTMIDTKQYQKGKRVLESLGLNPVEARHAHDRWMLFAGEDEARADDINRAFADKSVDAIICLRGGAGTARLLPLIDFTAIKRNPKILIGYSDITALQLAVLAKAGLVTFYGPMVTTDMGRNWTRFSQKSLLDTLTTAEHDIETPIETGGKTITLYPGGASGRLVGGCLSIVVSMLGTEWEIDTRNRILFLEDIDERPHRVDRYLTQLYLAGKLQKARGFLFGSFSRCDYPPGDEHHSLGVRTLDIIKEWARRLGKPCLAGVQFGHVADKITMPMGGQAFMDATGRRLTLGPAVR
jgi:muramoyltetrapeptide carboxypeptidase